MTDFSGVDSRLKWARSRRKALERSMNYYQKHHPHYWRPKIADDRMSWTLSVAIDKTPPVTEWGLWFAEIIHDLRSVLDNIVWVIAHAHGVPTRPNRLEFPIVSDSTKWAQASGKISEVPDHAKTYIESIQPFKTGQENSVIRGALRLLNELDIQNKHHAPVIAGVSGPQTVRNEWKIVYKEDPSPSEVSTVKVSPFKFEDGWVVWHQTVPKPIKKVEYGKFDIEAYFVVSNEQGRQFPVLGCIDVMLESCNQVVERLKALDE